MATARCKRCGKPLCNDCKIVTEVGVVCSQQCLDAIKAFQERIKDDVPKPRRHSFLRSLIKSLLGVAILFGIAYAILCWRAGRVLSWSGVLDQLRGWAWLFRSLF